MREWLARFVDWFRRDWLDRELAEELRFHGEQLERDSGIAGAEAGRTARRQLGNVTMVREAARERWSIPALDQVLQDTRFAVRGLRRSPGFTATVVVTLALGIGGNVAMFDVVDRLMYRPLAYLRDPASTHRIYWQWRDRGVMGTRLSAPYTRYLDLRRWTTSFAELAAFSERQVAVGEGESTRERRVGTVSASWFTLFDARPALGRFFAADEDVTPRGADVAVLSHAFWRSAFGGRDVRGERLQVGNVRATIIGVAPPGFSGVDDANPPDLFIPITTYAASTGTDDARTYFNRYLWGWVNVLVRVKPGVTLAQAERDATEAFRRSWQAARDDSPMSPALDDARPQVRVSSIRTGAGPDPGLEARTALWLTMVAGIVLLIACANVANLVLARFLQRQRETALRLALGVGQGRLAMQALIEGLALAFPGGVAGLLVAQWAGAALRGTLVTTPGAPTALLSDGRTLGVTLGLTVLVGIVIGLVPALLRTGRDLARALRGGMRSGTPEGIGVRTALLVAQGALSVVLLVGAALFVRSLQAVRAMPLGYEPGNVLLLNRVIRGAGFDADLQRATRDVMLSTAQAVPEVEFAAWMSSAPFVSTSATILHVAGMDSVERLGSFTFQATTPDYFRTMGTRIVRGRALDREDRAGSPPVAIVSESMARVLWPGQDAMGQCFRMRDPTASCTTIVGIAEDIVQHDLAGAERFHYYVSIDQYTRTWGNGMVLRVRGDAGAAAEGIRQAVQGVMPGEQYVTVRRLSDVVHAQQRPWQLGATMFVAFGGLALVVAAVGLYGVIGYSVAQRMHELGVRIALGAQRRDIVRLVTGQGVRSAFAGVALGVLVALAASRWLQPLLFRQSATDPVVYGGVVVVMMGVAVAACLLPALRASRAAPTAALRSE
ncbi:MAG TPA: ABC transporter permease [Gemmatimonadaceae bacterium]